MKRALIAPVVIVGLGILNGIVLIAMSYYLPRTVVLLPSGSGDPKCSIAAIGETVTFDWSCAAQAADAYRAGNQSVYGMIGMIAVEARRQGAVPR